MIATREPWTLEMLGGLRLRRGGEVVSPRFRSEKTAALLAYLALRPRRTERREALVHAFWPECDGALGRNNLSKSLSSIRAVLEPPGAPEGSVVTSSRAEVGLAPGACATDVEAFDAALASAAAAAGDEDAAARHLERAVELFRGDLLPGLEYEWVLTERTRLRRAALDALHELVAHYECVGALSRARVLARQAVGIDPLHEPAHRDIMSLHLAAGEPEQALSQFRQLEALLERELGTSPSAGIRGLAREIERRLDAGAPRTPAAPSPRPSGRGVATVVALAGAGPVLEALKAAAAKSRGSFSGEREGVALFAFARATDALAALSAAGAAPAGVVTFEQAEGGTVSSSGKERAARIARSARRGQVLCSEETTLLARSCRGGAPEFIDHGYYLLEGAQAPERLFEWRPPGARGSGAAPPDATPILSPRIPLEPSPFFGREQELAWVDEAMGPGGARLVTLVGPGGVGKTRLALESARRLSERFRGAVIFVGLASVEDAGAVPDAIGAALRLCPRPCPSALECVVAALGRGPILLVLDNLEHLGDEGAAVARALLSRVEGLRCIATSQRRLGIPGERELPLRPLPVPEGGEDPAALGRIASVRLFVEGVRTMRPDFRLTDENAPDVAEICRRLDGLPLAIKLAAGQGRVLGPAEILARSERALDLPMDAAADEDPRHATLRRTFEWSLRLVAPALRDLLARLSVFRGGFDLAAAEAVGCDPLVLERLAELASWSLVDVRPGRRGTRYRLLEPLRAFAAEHVREDEREPLRRRHAEHFLALAEEERRCGLSGPSPRAAFDRLEEEHENLRAALAWSLEAPSRVEAGLRLAAALAPFWTSRTHLAEGTRWLERLIAAGSERSTARALALCSAGVIAQVLGDLAGSCARLDEAVEIAREREAPPVLAAALVNRACTALSRGDLATAERALDEGLAAARTCGDRRVLARAKGATALLALHRGDREVARARYEECLALQREVGDGHGAASTLYSLALIGPERSARLEESIAIYREAGDPIGEARSLHGLAETRLEEGDSAAARALYEQGLALAARHALRHFEAYARLGLGRLDVHDGDLRGGERHIVRAYDVARALGDTSALECALCALGDLARLRDERAEARARYLESVSSMSKRGAVGACAASCLEGLAVLAVAEGEPARATRLLAAADALRARLGTRRAPFERGAAERVSDACAALGEAERLAERRAALSSGRPVELLALAFGGAA